MSVTWRVFTGDQVLAPANMSQTPTNTSATRVSSKVKNNGFDPRGAESSDHLQFAFHIYIGRNRYTNVAAGLTMAFAVEAATILGLSPPSLADWEAKSASMYVPLQQYQLRPTNTMRHECAQEVSLEPAEAMFHLHVCV
jgi:hypothetical protein